MKTGCLLLGTFAVVTLAGPAKRDCPQFKCFNATNECGVAFSEYVHLHVLFVNSLLAKVRSSQNVLHQFFFVNHREYVH
jgi:predicted metal-binding protein